MAPFDPFAELDWRATSNSDISRPREASGRPRSLDAADADRFFSQSAPAISRPGFSPPVRAFGFGPDTSPFERGFGKPPRGFPLGGGTNSGPLGASSSTPTIDIAVADAQASETGLDPGQLIVFADQNVAGDLTVYYTVSGSATPGQDYVALPGTVVIPAGQRTATIDIQPLADGFSEDWETMVLRLAHPPTPVYSIPCVETESPIDLCPSGTVVIGPGIGTPPLPIRVVIGAPIIPGDPPIPLPPSDECASETPGDPATIIIGRSGAIDNPLTIRLWIAGTATPGVDYQALPNEVTIPANERYTTLTVNPIADSLVEGPETIEVSLRSGFGYELGTPYLFEVHLQDAQQSAQVVSIEYRPTGQGTTGDLSQDNPNALPDFQGGWRFFPDAATYATRDASRNIVRVRATVTPAQANICVYFRAFDVDDPSSNATIDANAGNGRDNRGRVNANATMPEDSVDPAQFPNTGYRGRLSRAGANSFAAEGAILEVKTNAQGQAEVDLATSFAPGDNFRVVASTNRQEVANLNDLTSVPTSAAMAGFGGKVTDQLSVWRRFHFEQDRMDNDPAVLGDRQAGTITAPPVLVDPRTGIYRVQTNITIRDADEYKNGILRTAAGLNFLISANSSGDNATVDVSGNPGMSNITLYQDDWAAIGNAAPTLRVNTQNDAELYMLMQASSLRTINRYADAYLEPEYATLNQFDSTNVTAATHLLSHFILVNDFRATRTAGSETDVFWVVYISTAYEGMTVEDNDPTAEYTRYGETDDEAPRDRQISVAYLEAIRDGALDYAQPVTDGLARVGAHEVAHQFGLVNELVPFSEPFHRDDNANIMHKDALSVPSADFFFNSAEIAYLRLRRRSPGPEL